MTLERDLFRQNVASQISLGLSSGLWEDEHLDFKTNLPTDPLPLAGTIKLMLAFANTPRSRDAYIIYGVKESADRGREHIGVSIFPSKDRLEQLIHEYTKLQAVVIDADYVLDGKRTPFVVVPIQDEGPYAMTKRFAQAPKALDPSLIYMRRGSRIVTAGELESRKMSDWPSWAVDGRYISSLDELETLIRRSFSALSLIERKDQYVRFSAEHAVADNLGKQRLLVLGHAYPGFSIPSEDKLDALQRDSLPGTHARWLVCHRPPPARDRLGIRILTLEDLFIAADVYGRYCRAYLDSWKADRAASRLGVIVDLDFRDGSTEGRQASILSWLGSSLRLSGPVPTVVCSEFGTGKSITLRHLVADICEDYLRRSSRTRAVYIDLNSIDIRADRHSFVERALLRLPGLELTDIQDIFRQVDQGNVCLVLDGVDEMARPYSPLGRQEAFQLIKENLNAQPCIVSVRPNYFASRTEMLERISDLARYDPERRRHEYRMAQLCELTPLQVEELLSSGLADREEGLDTKRVIGELGRSGLGSFLKDPLVLSLCIDMLRSDPAFRLDGAKSRVVLVSSLLKELMHREWEKRHRHRGLLRDDQFVELLGRLAYAMVRDDARTFGTDSIEAHVLALLRRETGGAEESARQMAAQFRTQTWLSVEGDSYRFRHDVFTQVLAAQYIVRNMFVRSLEGIRDWNAGSVHALPVIGAVRELLHPDEALLAAGCLVEGSVTASARTLILDTLRNLDLAVRGQAVEWISKPEMQAPIGAAIKAAAKEPDIAPAVASCLSPLMVSARVAVEAVLCFLAVAKQSPGYPSPAVLGVLRDIMKALTELSDNEGRSLSFKELLRELRENPNRSERMVKAAGLSRGLGDPFVYESLFGDFTERLPANVPDAPTWRYVRAAAQYLRSYVVSKTGSPSAVRTLRRPR